MQSDYNLSIEQYAVKYKRLHPAVVIEMSPFFKNLSWNLSRAKIKIISPFWGSLSGRGSPTAVFVLGRTIYIMRGAINAKEMIRGNNWNLASPIGFATLAHEVFHVYQYDRGGFFRYIGGHIGGMWKSLTRSKKLYDHQFFKSELEAIKFQRMVHLTVNRKDLQQFVGMR